MTAAVLGAQAEPILGGKDGHTQPIGPVSDELGIKETAFELLQGYIGADYKLVDVDEALQSQPKFKEDHAFHDTLYGLDKINIPYILEEVNGSGIKSVITYGKATRGHPALVHGGITAMTFDNLFGWALFRLGRQKVFTANIKVDYKAPLPCGTTTMVDITIEKEEGRKLYLKGTISSLDNAITYAEATSLFVIPKNQEHFKAYDN